MSDYRRTVDYAQLLLRRRRTIKRLRQNGQFLLYHEKLALPCALLLWATLTARVALPQVGLSLQMNSPFSAAAGLLLLLLAVLHRSSLRLSYRTHGAPFALAYLGFSSVLSILHGVGILHGLARYGLCKDSCKDG
jgi:hypothetical protein